MLSGNKKHINMLANIDNYLGDHEGKMAPVLTFLGVSAVPFLIYALFLMRYVKFRYVLVFGVAWTARWALYILGEEPKKKLQYRRERENVYKTADQLIHVSHVADDGLIEYNNGNVAYILVGYILDYVDDVSLTLDLQNFLKQLRGYSYDIYSQMVIGEYRLEDDINKLKVYTDKEAIKDRMLFYQEQDEYCSQNSECFRICIEVKGSKYDWVAMRKTLDHLVNSEAAYCWRYLHIATPEDDTDVFSRDLCLDVNVNDMLVEKYKSDEYYGSKVLFYGEKIPKQYQQKKNTSNVAQRRMRVR